MEKEFNYTSLQCDSRVLKNLFEESKYISLDLYAKINGVLYHVLFKANLENEISDNEYIVNDQKFFTYLEFIDYANNVLLNNGEIELLEINGDGPHYHKVIVEDYVHIERKDCVTSFERKNVQQETKELIQVFTKPGHTWIMLENLVYLAVIIFASYFGINSLVNFEPNVYNVGLIILALVLGVYAFKDYFKYRIELYTSKIKIPNIKTKEFTLSFKEYREIHFKDIRTIIYVINPRQGKTGKELVIINNDGGQRVISLNVLNKKQYIDVCSKLVEALQNYYK